MRMTKDEILLVVIVLLALLVGATGKFYRQNHPHAPPPEPVRKPVVRPPGR